MHQRREKNAVLITYWEKGTAEGPLGEEKVLKRKDMVPEKMPSMRSTSSPVRTSELSVLITGCKNMAATRELSRVSKPCHEARGIHIIVSFVDALAVGSTNWVDLKATDGRGRALHNPHTTEGARNC